MWTNIPKPSVQAWVNLNTAKPTYDESTIIYDDPGIYYDGFNPAAWIDIPKPTTNNWTNIPKPT